MSEEARQALTTVVIATLIAAILIGLAWVSMADLVFVVLAGVLGLAVGWTLGARHVAAQVQHQRQRRRRQPAARQPRKRG